MIQRLNLILFGSTEYYCLSFLDSKILLQHQHKPASMEDVQFEKAETIIRALMDERQIPGVSLALVELDPSDDKSRCCGFGFSDIKEQKPVTTSTKMCIGSITKCFTSALLAQQLQYEKK